MDKEKLKQAISKTIHRKFQGLTYCRGEKKHKSLLAKTSSKCCTVCGFKIRGRNHKEGSQHKRAVKQNEKVFL